MTSLRHLSDRIRRRWDAASPWLAAATLLGAFHWLFLLYRYPSAGAGSLLARRLLATGFPLGFPGAGLVPGFASPGLP